jgi:hypothetical protein
MSKARQYVVIAIGPSGSSWLSVPNDEGERSLVSREQACLFPNPTAAHAAVSKLPRAFPDADIRFTVQSAP